MGNVKHGGAKGRSQKNKQKKTGKLMGGARQGAGRKKGGRNKITKATLLLQGLSVSELARNYTEEALNTIVQIMRDSEFDSMRLAAATAILDRGYGRPPAAVLLQGDVKHEVVYQRLADVVADLRKSGIPLELPDLTGLVIERTADNLSADQQVIDQKSSDHQGSPIVTDKKIT